MGNRLDLIGKRFDRLVVLNRVGSASNGDVLYLCQCDCGNQKVYRASNIKHGYNKSCGCKHRDVLVERNWRGGFSQRDKRIHQMYKDMIYRCYSKKCKAYRWYGAKGITVCPEWLADENSFFDFCEKYGYNKDLTIDRIDSSKGYCPENCRFVDVRFNALRGVFKREYGYEGSDKEVKEAYGY